MLLFKRLYAPEGASGGEGASGVTSPDAGESAGVTSADAGQSFEGRLEELGVPRDKIRKGAYRNAAKFQKPQPEAAPEQAEAPGGDAGRKTWDEIKAEYKTDYDTEVQGMIQQRVKKEQERVQKYADRENTLAPIVDFLAGRYHLDTENLDLGALVQKFREDNSLSQDRALEMGTSEEVAHKLDLAEQEDRRRQREEKARQQQLAEAFKRQQVGEHLQNLQAQAAEFQRKVPGFNLQEELKNNKFFMFTQPGGVSVEEAYYALHPEFRQAEVQSVAQRATEAVASSVRAGQTRPAENGAQAATVSKVSYRNMPKADREALKQRIRAAGQRGEHLPYGG